MKTAAAAVLASMALTALAAPAHAEPVPDADRFAVSDITVVQFAMGNVVAGAGFGLAQSSGARPAAGVSVRVAVTSCGNPIIDVPTVTNGESAGTLVWFNATQEASVSENELNQQIGRSFEYVLTITQPGYDAYTLTGSSSAYTVTRPSCEVINSPGYGDDATTITVTKWSAKKGATSAKVGKTLKVTPTRAAGAKVVYAWRVGGKTVDRDRAMTVKKAYKGKRVALRVTVFKAGAKTISKTLRYGRAH